MKRLDVVLPRDDLFGVRRLVPVPLPMSLFDRLRPKWKHSDPAVRLEAVGVLEDQNVLESLAEHDSEQNVRAAAIRALSSPVVIARLALSAELASVRELAVERMDDRSLLRKIASSDPSPTVRACARSRCSDTHSAGAYFREILSKLPVAERKAEQAAEFCGTLDEVCKALSHDPRFFVNGDVASDDESGTAQLRDTTRVAWATATSHSERKFARFVAEPRPPTDSESVASGPVYFFHVKVWRTAENQFDLRAEEKQFSSTNDAVAWSRASSGGQDARPVVDPDAPSA